MVVVYIMIIASRDNDLPSIGMPSFHQDNWAGGLLELESQMMVASMPGFNSSGSMRILTVSGATGKFNSTYNTEI